MEKKAKGEAQTYGQAAGARAAKKESREPKNRETFSIIEIAEAGS